MLFKRLLIETADFLPAKLGAGDGFVGNPGIAEKTNTTNHTLFLSEMAKGIVYYSALSAGITVTTPTAALITDAAAGMDVGDSFFFLVSIQDAFAITWAAGTGVTLRGRPTTPASSSTWVIVTKTSATTYDWFVA